MVTRGWRRIPPDHPLYSPTARLYFDPSNRVRSRRAYDDVRLQREGWDNKRDFDTRKSARKNAGYKNWIAAANRNLDVPEKELGKADSEFNQMFLRARDDGFPTDPDGTFAEFLIYTGLRQPDQAYSVGDTPTT